MKAFSKTLTLAMGAALLALTAGAAQAQDVNGEPYAGTVRLDAGFPDDPRVVNTTPGGSVDASDLGGPCVGFISSRPDVRLHYNAGSFPLILRTRSSSDTTLVVNAPDGNFYCNDDDGGNLNALLRFGSPMSGRYEIWIGRFDSTPGGSAQLLITELD